jgi:predicted phosphodiesterase
MVTRIKMKKFLLMVALVTACKSKPETKESSYFEIGIISDCQYCDCNPRGNRFYRKSLKRLKYAVQELNKKNLLYTIHLGDFIDHDFKSFDSVLPVWNQLKSQKYHVLGNHDFSVADSLKPLVFSKMKLKKRYYSFVKNNWRFIVLDGSDLSYYGTLSNEKRQERDSVFNALKSKNAPNSKIWNGGLSASQLQWIKTELDQAQINNENVGFYCHFPAVKKEVVHNLWNYKQFLNLINDYENVKFYFNGHNHNGDYIEKNGVHHLTYKGMLDTKDSLAFATVKFTKDTIIVVGHGREVSRSLKIK